MKALILGDSDSDGSRTGGVNWPDMVVADLSASGMELEFGSVRFSAIPTNSPTYAERKVRELAPDIVIVPISAWVFTIQFVEYRVERLLGKRAARLYKRWETRFEHATRKGAAQPAGMNKAGRSLIRGIIGTESQTSAAQLAANYHELFRVLARFENTQIVAMMYPGINRATLPGKVARIRADFVARVKKSADSFWISWVSGEDMFPFSIDMKAFALDEVHFNEAGHRRIADAMLKAIQPLATAETARS